MATVTTRPPSQPDPRGSVPPTPATTDAPVKPDSAASRSFVEPERRHGMICEAAYFLSESRGFCPGRELDDWLAAESAIDRALTSGEPADRCGGGEPGGALP